MIIRKLNTQQLINLLKQVKKEGYEHLDIVGVLNSFQDTIKVITREEYKTNKTPAKIVSYKLTESIINALIE